MTENQIHDMESAGVARQTVSFISPADGYVFFENSSLVLAGATTRGPVMQGMESGTPVERDLVRMNSGDQIREGSYVSSGQTLFTINSLETVWVIVSVPAEFSGFVEQKPVAVYLKDLPGEKYVAKFLLTEPVFSESQQRFARVRMRLDNPSKSIRPNTIVTAEIPVEEESGIRIPAGAVYRTGQHSYAWVKTGTTQEGAGIFELRQVETGRLINGMITILRGLTAGDVIAKEAGMMVDSETLLNKD